MLNVALDGPSGAGKSTAAKAAAIKKGLNYVDTGALYRAVGYVLAGSGVDLEDETQVAQQVPQLKVRLYYEEDGQHVSVNGEDVTPYLRTAQAGMGASKVAVHGCVRELLLEIQRQAGREYDVIMDGRDIGTNVLPSADLKIYITASAEERGRRRYGELEKNGTLDKTLEEIIAEINERDYRDMNREIAPLKQAEDAVLLDTTEMNLEEVVEAVCRLIDEAKAAKTSL